MRYPARMRRESLRGRDRERALLVGALEDAIGGRGTVVTISGAPGIGKSALAELVADEAAARKVSILRGRASRTRRRSFPFLRRFARSGWM
jgi:predicted ATPase